MIEEFEKVDDNEKRTRRLKDGKERNSGGVNKTENMIERDKNKNM